MTDPQTYFHEATATLEPDVDALVAGGLERGRARRARRTALTALGAGAAVAVLTVGAVAVPGMLRADPNQIAPGSGSGNERAGRESLQAEESTAPAQQVRQLTVEPAEVPATFASVVPGEVAGDQAFPSDHDGAIAHFHWNGAFTSVFLDLLPGKPPLARCRATAGPDMSCEEQPDGSALLTWQERQPMRDGGVTGRGTSLFTADGWEVAVISYNAAEPKAFEYVAPEPPLSFAQLEQAVTSDVWFR